MCENPSSRSFKKWLPLVGRWIFVTLKKVGNAWKRRDLYRFLTLLGARPGLLRGRNLWPLQTKDTLKISLTELLRLSRHAQNIIFGYVSLKYCSNLNRTFQKIKIMFEVRLKVQTWNPSRFFFGRINASFSQRNFPLSRPTWLLQVLLGMRILESTWAQVFGTCSTKEVFRNGVLGCRGKLVKGS